MFIAPGYTDNYWKKLNLDEETSEDWVEAIKILEGRIRGRYLDPADMLVDKDEKTQPAKNRRFGFTILAIDCLVIETFQAFIEGRKDTKNHSKRMFKNFLTTRSSFSRYFNIQSAERFYSDIRCGILHQAEVPANCKVWSVGPLLNIDRNTMVINRTKLHNALKTEFNSYLEDLGNPQNRNLRNNFRKKMDFICQV